MLTLYKFRSLGDCESLERTIDILETGAFWCAKLWDMNDPMEGVFNYERAATHEADLTSFFSEKNRRVMCSFSGERAFRSPTMWGYYANGLKGIAIEVEVDVEEGEVDEGEIHRVKYVPTVASLFSELSDDENGASRLQRILTTKLVCWHGENEYRYLAHSPRNCAIKIGKIVGIHIGWPCVTLALREPARSLGGGRFDYREWDVTQTIDRTPASEADHCMVALSLPRAVYPGRSSFSVAEQDPVVIPLYFVEFDVTRVILDPSSLLALPGHRFRNGDEVIYEGATPIGGSADGETYFVVNAEGNSLQVAAVSGGSPIALRTAGSGTQRLFRRPKVNPELLAGKDYSSTNAARTTRTFLIRTPRGTLPAGQVNDPLDTNLQGDILAELSVKPADSPQREFAPSAVDPVADVVTINGHGFGEGVRLNYTASDTPIGGLASGTSYYVVNATTNTFQLAVDEGGPAINILTRGTGTHRLAGLWSDIGEDVFRYTGSIDTEWTIQRRSSGTIGLYRYELDPDTAVWTRFDSPGGFLSYDIIDESAIVPDAPLSMAIVAHPKSDPSRIRLVGSGRIEPRMQMPGVPKGEVDAVSWQSHTMTRALFRRHVLPGSGQAADLDFGVRLTGSDGEAIPF